MYLVFFKLWHCVRHLLTYLLNTTTIHTATVDKNVIFVVFTEARI